MDEVKEMIEAQEKFLHVLVFIIQEYMRYITSAQFIFVPHSPSEGPPRFPNLTPIDFTLSEWLESEKYKKKVNTRNELITGIVDGTAHIKNRQVKYIEVGGGIFESFHWIVIYLLIICVL